MRNEEECVCSVCLFRYNILISGKIMKDMAVSVASGTPYILQCHECYDADPVLHQDGGTARCNTY